MVRCLGRRFDSDRLQELWGRCGFRRGRTKHRGESAMLKPLGLGVPDRRSNLNIPANENFALAA